MTLRNLLTELELILQPGIGKSCSLQREQESFRTCDGVL